MSENNRTLGKIGKWPMRQVSLPALPIDSRERKDSPQTQSSPVIASTLPSQMSASAYPSQAVQHPQAPQQTQQPQKSGITMIGAIGLGVGVAATAFVVCSLPLLFFMSRQSYHSRRLFNLDFLLITRLIQARAFMVSRGRVGALGRSFYKGGFEQKMNRKEAALILELPYVLRTHSQFEYVPKFHISAHASLLHLDLTGK